jgi:hypothetical protein
MLQRYTFILFTLVIPFCTFSQILNLEKYRVEGDSLKPYAFNLNGSFSANNRSAAVDNPVNLLGYNFSLHSVYTPKKHAYIFIAHRNFLRINDNPFINFGYVHTRVNFYRKNRMNFEVFSQLSDDNFRGLLPRWINGGALRYRIIDKEKTDFIIGLGAFLEFERWFHPTTDARVDVLFLKGTFNVVYRHTFTDNFNLNGVVFYQSGYDASLRDFRHRTSGNIHINTKITERFTLTNFFDFSYEDKPIVPITKFLFSYRVGIGLDL